MISSLIDELNKSADEWNGSNMFELARMCREAADTIWELRDDLQRANAENAELRELCGFMLRCMKRNHDCDCCLVNGEHCEISYIESDARELGVEVD